MIPGERCDLVRAISPLLHRSMGRHREAHDMAYLLIVPGKTIEGEMTFKLTMVWVHPHQTNLHSLDKAWMKLTLLINIGDNWAYTFMQLKKGTLHVPLSSEGHISTMIDGVLSRSAYRHPYQLQVQRLLQCGSHVLCPEGLNGGG